jgi:hypothetical protein
LLLQHTSQHNEKNLSSSIIELQRTKNWAELVLAAFCAARRTIFIYFPSFWLFSALPCLGEGHANLVLGIGLQYVLHHGCDGLSGADARKLDENHP